ncbi:MAG: class A beta-lactamase-related serine hydrolase, partial [Sphingobacteriales bacterium]
MKKLILVFNLIIASLTAFAQKEVYRIDSLVNQYFENSEFNGTVLVAKRGEILLNKGYGYSNAEKKTANAAHTVFGIASITKTFTSALILKLQEAGKLSVQDPLSKFDPDFPNGNKITVHHLLTHTSGLSDYINDPAFRKTDQSKEQTLSAMMGFFKNKPLDFEPGTKFRYSNSGYTMLGYIIEKVTGKSYASALQQLVFKPLGMENTSYGPDLN